MKSRIKIDNTGLLNKKKNSPRLLPTKTLNRAIDIAKDLLPSLAPKVELNQQPPKPTLAYPEELNPFRSALELDEDKLKATKPYPEELNPFQFALKLDEDENRKLNEFLEKAFLTSSIEELSKVVDEALHFGIMINARSEDGFSFSNFIILKMSKDGLTDEKIITKLALNGADFDAPVDEKTTEICKKVQKEVEPQVFNRLKKLREVAENASMSGTVKDVEFDNRTFYMEFSKNSIVDMGKVIDGARSLGFDKGDLKLGGNIIKIGNGEIEVKTGKNGERNYVDVSDNSSFTVTFQTSLGELHVKVYQDVKNYDQVQVEVENKDAWNKLQQSGEVIGEGCLFGGISVNEAAKKGSFVRSGKWTKSTEIIKYTKPQNSEIISWVDRTKSDKTASMARS